MLRAMHRRAILAGIAAGLAASSFPALAQEAKEVRFAKQFGISYLPMVVMEEMKLVEKHAAKAGLGDVKVSWLQLTGGAPVNDALIAGQIDFAAGGVGPLITIWAKTKGTLDVRCIGAINSMPLYLNTVNPDVKTVKDFTEKDRIALPSVKVSIQAVTLMMAAEKAFGQGKHGELDRLTVSMSHPDGMAAMLSGKSEITAHFSSAPFQYQQLQDARVKRVLSSYEVLGGPATFNLIWGKAEFAAKNPKLFAAVFSAMEEAMEFINANQRAAAEMWVKAEKSKLAVDFAEKLIKDPENKWTTTPEKVMVYADFMHRIGAIKEKPASWKDLCHAAVHGKQGS